MTKRDKIIQAAANIEGSAVMLSEKWDCYLIGYTVPEGTKTVLGEHFEQRDFLSVQYRI